MMLLLGFVIFIAGIIGFYYNVKNSIMMLICIELIFLGITVLIIVFSYVLDDIIGFSLVIYLISLAGAESAIGLSLIVGYYRLKNTAVLDYN